MAGRKEKISILKNPANPEVAPLDLTVKDLKPVGKGSGLWSDKVETGIAYSETDPRVGEMAVAIKHYEGEHNFEEHAAVMARIYKGMKEAGLKVPTTLRFDMEKKLSIMTYLNRDGYVALADDNQSDLVKFKSLRGIAGFEKLLPKLFDHALDAAKKKFLLPTDSYFMLIDPMNKKDTDFIIADFDIVHDESRQQAMIDSTGRQPMRGMPEENLSRAKTFLLGFCGTWLIPSIVNEYCQVIMKEYAVATAKLEATFDAE